MISLNWARENLHGERGDVDEEWLDVQVILRKWSIRWLMADGERTAERSRGIRSDLVEIIESIVDLVNFRAPSCSRHGRSILPQRRTVLSRPPTERMPRVQLSADIPPSPLAPRPHTAA